MIESLGVLVNSLILLVLFFQLRSLSKQTKLLGNNIRFESYLRQVDQLNAVNKALLQPASLEKCFKKLDGFDPITRDYDMTEIAFAWLVINRYESAFVGKKLGVIPDDEWEIWENRIRKDFEHEVVLAVWKRDLDGFDYSRGFKDLVNDILARS